MPVTATQSDVTAAAVLVHRVSAGSGQLTFGDGTTWEPDSSHLTCQYSVTYSVELADGRCGICSPVLAYVHDVEVRELEQRARDYVQVGAVGFCKQGREKCRSSPVRGRYWYSSGAAYKFHTPTSGEYEVTLHFSDSYITYVGGRKFGVTLEGNTVEAELDIVAQVPMTRVCPRSSSLMTFLSVRSDHTQP